MVALNEGDLQYNWSKVTDFTISSQAHDCDPGVQYPACDCDIVFVITSKVNGEARNW